MLTIGIVAYFALLPVSALVPSLTAIASALGTLLILGFWLRLYGAASTHNSGQTLLILATLPLLPLATLTTGGFIGFGTVWALSVATFLFVIARRRIWFYLAAPFVIFLGLSLFVTYAQQRDEIRDVVWYQNAGIMQRLDKVSTLVTDFQLLDLSNERHLYALDLRLNQNWLLGVGVMRHREGEVELLYGATVPFWALIPRAIWPDKPAVGGGRDLVTEFTGIGFDESTSVGAGQVLEFYANFGMPGVLAGFAVLGFILMRLDQRMMRAFAMRNINGVISNRSARVGAVAAVGQSPGNHRCGGRRNHYVATSCPLEIIGFAAHTEASENGGTDDAGDRAAMTRRLRIAVATAGRFHFLDLARELTALGYEWISILTFRKRGPSVSGMYLEAVRFAKRRFGAAKINAASRAADGRKSP